MGSCKVESRRLPGRAGPVQGAVLEREGRAVGGEADAAAVVCHVAAKCCRHSGSSQTAGSGARYRRCRGSSKINGDTQGRGGCRDVAGSIGGGSGDSADSGRQGAGGNGVGAASGDAGTDESAAAVNGDGAVGFRGAGEDGSGDVGNVVDRGSAGVAGVRQIGGRRSGRGGGVDRDSQSRGSERDVASCIGGCGSNAVGSRRESAGGDRVVPACRRAAANLCCPVIDLDGTAGLRGAREGGSRVAGNVVDAGTAAVAGGCQIGGGRSGRGGGVDRDSQSRGGDRDVARCIGGCGSDSVDAGRQGADRDGVDATGGDAGADLGGAVVDLDGAAGFRGAGEGGGGDVGEVVGVGTAAVAGVRQIGYGRDRRGGKIADFQPPVGIISGVPIRGGLYRKGV